jgi:hypothetical protein
MVSLKASFPTAKWTTVLQIWGSRKVTSLVGGGTRYSKLENRRNPELGKVPWNLDTHEDRTHNGVDIVVLMSSALTTRPPSCLRRCKKKTRISESRKPEKVDTQNGEMISISPLRCRNFEFLLFRLCVFAFTISRFNFVFQKPKQSLTYYSHSS